MARFSGDEYDAWRDEFLVPTPKRRDPIEYRERVSEPLKEGENNVRAEKCNCGGCRICLMTEW